jgi:hypothetical protein
MIILLTIYLICVVFGVILACLEPKTGKHPIVISNHVKAIGMEYPKGSFIRINLAWAGTVSEVKNIINNAGDHKIYLDYPTGRTKPPQPSMTLLEAQNIANEFAEHIAYFAFSNAWDAAKPDFIAAMRKTVDKRIKLVPKIETKGGVNHLEEIVRAADTDMVMLDAEDLYVNCNHSPKIFDKYKKKCRQRCKELGVMCIELKGVVFGYES